MRKIFVFATSIMLCLGVLGFTGNFNSTSLTSTVSAAQNAELDFTIVNKTGYDIKALYIGATGTGDWTKDDEVLHGKTFKNGAALKIEFHPKAKAAKWDIMVAWADGSGNEEWEGLNLTQIEKLTLVYDEGKDVTSAIIE
jgi:hypothetical protein